MMINKIIHYFPVTCSKKANLVYRKDKSSSQSIWDNSTEQYQRDDFKLYWELLPLVEKYQMECMTGDGDINYFDYSLNYLKENISGVDLKCLFIGCLEGNPGPEMSLMETGLFNSIDVMDIAEGLLKKQHDIASQKGLQGIKYIKQDFNDVALKINEYDLIWAIGTAHHVEKLEPFFDQINTSLSDNGIFVMREYIGPNRMQFTDIQLNIVNEIICVLPDKYKTNPEGFIKGTITKPDINELIKKDPSESIRSQDIISVMEKRLNILELAYTGGTILHPLLGDIATNFERDQDAETLLKLLILFEKTLVEKEVLQSDYVFCIANKRI